MALFKKNYSLYVLLLFFALSLTNCAAKKKIVIQQKTTEKTDKISDKNILYLIDGKEISSKDIHKINTNNIHSITVIKGKKDIKKYTDKYYDGVVIITMKKL